MSDELITEETKENPNSKKTFFGPKSIFMAAAILAVAVVSGMVASGVFNFTDKKAKANYEAAMDPIKSDIDAWLEQVTAASGYSIPAYKVVLPDLLQEHEAIQKRAEAISPGSDDLKHAHKSYLEALFHQHEALKALNIALSYEDPEQISYFAAKATPHTDAARAKFDEYNLLMSLIEDSE